MDSISSGPRSPSPCLLDGPCPSSPPAAVTMTTDPTMSSIVKNSTIPVNVDDLGSGLIVVTFTHSNGSLYQGVLLQLNRERGIPCGISFPKDYCSTIPSKSMEFDEENEQPPLEDRHTYFHTSPNAPPPPKPLRRFHRATKPPARYKNGRLALRLRHRPVLCSKCKAFCEEKNPPPPPKASPPEPPCLESEESGGGVTTRRNNDLRSKSLVPDSKSPESSSVTASNGAHGGSNGSEEPDDLAYTVVGPQSGLVENYWKRPSPLPPPPLMTVEKNRSVVKNDLAPTSGVVDTTAVSPPINQSISQSAAEAAAAVSSGPTSALLQTKRQNLRICISKLTLQNHNTNPERRASSYIDSKELLISRPTYGRRSSRRDPSSDSETFRKRSTTVPARFRDEGCVTSKKVFDFKRRRQEQGSSPAEEVTLTTPPKPLPPETAPFEDPTHLNNGFHSPPPASRKMSEVNRTPTIKISYGSSGKGVVIEIPSKPTVEVESEDNENVSSSEKSKAEKKALRKAKKQAKRKMSKVTVDDLGPLTTAAVPPPSFDLSSSQSSCSSPPPPLLTPISELCPLIIDEDCTAASALETCPPLIHFTKEIPLTPNKKRKKEKKHKKYKVEETEADLLSIVS